MFLLTLSTAYQEVQSLGHASFLAEQYFPRNINYIQVFKKYSKILLYVLMV